MQTAKSTARMASVFLDTAYAIALISPYDTFHVRARELSLELETSSTQVVTTRAVMLELGNALSKQRFRHVAVQLLDTLEADPRIEIVRLSEELYAEAYKLYRTRTDKEWGLIDCVSFALMRDR